MEQPILKHITLTIYLLQCEREIRSVHVRLEWLPCAESVTDNTYMRGAT